MQFNEELREQLCECFCISRSELNTVCDEALKCVDDGCDLNFTNNVQELEFAYNRMKKSTNPPVFFTIINIAMADAYVKELIS